MLKLGPILKFLGCENDQWRLGMLAGTADSDLATELNFASSLLNICPRIPPLSRIPNQL